MKLIFRILLFSFYLILTLPAAHAVTQTADSTDVDTASKEKLSPVYMTIENQSVSADANINFASLSAQFDHLASAITVCARTAHQTLLKWTEHKRSTGLEVDNYNRRGQFGRWINDPSDGVCLNTRAKVLLRDSINPVQYRENNHCVVDEGLWKDPYTANKLNEARVVQIDHMVPLKNAYLSGAYNWSFDQRCLYANYLGYNFHLIPVSGTENMKKSDRGPEQYMPPNSSYACMYVRNWLAVKYLWGLTMTPAEAKAIQKTISDQNCDTRQFRITRSEVEKQKRFVRDNLNLCQMIGRP